MILVLTSSRLYEEWFRQNGSPGSSDNGGNVTGSEEKCSLLQDKEIILTHVTAGFRRGMRRPFRGNKSRSVTRMSSDIWDLSPVEHFRYLMGTRGGNILIDFPFCCDWNKSAAVWPSRVMDVQPTGPRLLRGVCHDMRRVFQVSAGFIVQRIKTVLKVKRDPSCCYQGVSDKGSVCAPWKADSA